MRAHLYGLGELLVGLLGLLGLAEEDGGALSVLSSAGLQPLHLLLVLLDGRLGVLLLLLGVGRLGGLDVLALLLADGSATLLSAGTALLRFRF